jgi:putative SOS response-associated peptidase YedK
MGGGYNTGMCGRYILRRINARRFGAKFDEHTPPFEEFTETAFTPRFNIAPSQDVAVVRINSKGDRVLGFVRWGLIPHWQKEKPKAQPINAKGETVATNGMFRDAFRRRRCILPADGFYEWKKLDAKTKQPMYIHFPDDRTFGFAGLWEHWNPQDGEPLNTCTIITTNANALMSLVHDRMPVILKPEDYDKWLDPNTPPAEAEALLKPYPDGELVADPVSTLVNSPKNDLPDCIKPIEEEEE